MKNARFKIAALVGGSVLLTLLIIVILFQVISSRQTDRRARESLKQYTEDFNISSSTQYTPNAIELMNGMENESLLSHSKLEQGIIEWCRLHDPEGIRKVKISSRTIYLKVVNLKDNTFLSAVKNLLGNEASGLFGDLMKEVDFLSENLTVIAYIDVTGDRVTIRNMSLFFLLAAFIIGLLGSVEGYLIGRRLERANLAEKQFFENTSHELKTPLTSIRGYAEGIEKGVITDYEKTGRVITKETEKMSRLIEEILLSARLDSGAMPLRRESLELNEFVEECLMPMEGAVRSRNLSVDLSLSPMTVSADPDRLEQAINNLITNALKYAKSRLAIRLTDGSLTIQNDCDGISDDDLSHLFDRFYAGENGNTGIGLSLAKEIIQLHGWKIRAERTNDGIRFVITIP